MVSRAEKALTEHERLLTRERQLWSGGLLRVAGLDEAGAGPWAGPVTAGCVVLDPNKLDALVGVNDSKKLSHNKRVEYCALIKAHAFAWAVAKASPEEIDEINIRQASLLAMRRALESVQKTIGSVDHLLIDARKLENIETPQEGIVRGDAQSLSIASASILAKVWRDEEMIDASQTYPEYGFEKHKGYGTKQHQVALANHGVTPIHRRSFAPIRMQLEKETETKSAGNEMPA